MADFPVSGRVYIDVPPFEPSTGGILAATEASKTLLTVADGDPALRGFQYETNGFAANSELSFVDCLKTAALSAVDGFDVVQSGAPFTVYNGYECNLAVMDRPAAHDTATQRLLGGETIGVEKHLWNITFDPAVDVTPVAGTPIKPKRALGLLAEWAGARYAGVPYFHVGRRLAVFLAGENLLSDLDDAAVKGGGVLVNGGGYYGDAAPGTLAAPTATQAWMYVTGRIVLVRGAVQTYEGVGPKQNNSVVVAERTYIPAVEAILGAILVDLT